MDVKGCTEVMGWKEGVSAGTMEVDVFTLNGEGVRMFRSILQHVTGMVSMVRKRFQKSSGPSKGKKTATIATKSTKKLTKRKKASVRAVKKA